MYFNEDDAESAKLGSDGLRFDETTERFVRLTKFVLKGVC